MKYLLGLTGFPLEHSLSPKLHAAALKAAGLEGDYRLYPVSPDKPELLEELVGRLRNGTLRGLNVTIPYKQAIIPLLDELTPSAKEIGAVNTVFVKSRRLVGDNTDAPGFLADIAKFLTGSNPKKNALILGAGGAARAIVYALLSDKWNVTLSVRRADSEQAGAIMDNFKQLRDTLAMTSTLLDAESLIGLLTDVGLIVNATPVGMSPETGFSPWPMGLPFPNDAAVYDLVYNPRQTRLVQDARAAGLRATTGLGMLVEQAALSFACWTGREVLREVMLAAVEA